MWLRRWDYIPTHMQNEVVRHYYDILSKKKLSLCLKKIFDILVSFILIVLLSPVFLLLAIFIKVDSKGPIFYKQERITQYGKTFSIIKFRTMVVNADKIGSLVTVQNDQRITKIGYILRRYRLDELPQLFNVIRGEMSFVGVRPEVAKYVDAYNDEMLATLLLPAGITSLASIQFKDEDSIISQHVNEQYSIDRVYIEKILPQKMEINLEYIRSFNFVKDCLICIFTVFKI